MEKARINAIESVASNQQSDSPNKSIQSDRRHLRARLQRQGARQGIE